MSVILVIEAINYKIDFTECSFNEHKDFKWLLDRI